MLRVGSKAGHYTVVSRIGAGAMGEVFRARDERLLREVALKVLPEKHLGTEDLVNRFLREAQVVSALNHPNVVTIFEIGEWEGAQFIAMEFVEGRSLRSYVPARIDFADFLKLAVQMARALVVTHAKGITHRDIKPENVIVRQDGIVKVLDFGLAKLDNQLGALAEPQAGSATLPGTIMGSPRYMSPEQAKGDKAGYPSDIFSLGIVLYEVACGRQPFQSESPMEVFRQIMSDDPPPPSRWRSDLPGKFDALIVRMLKKNQEERPTAGQVEQELEGMMRGADAVVSETPARAAENSSREIPTKSPEPANPAANRSERVPSPLTIARPEKQNWKPVLGVVAVILVATLLAVGLLRDKSIPVPPEKPLVPAPPHAAALNPHRIAVLPLDNYSPDAKDEYLSGGMTEELTSSLSKISGLEVVARTSSDRMKKSGKSLAEMGAELRAGSLLEGSVRKAGDQLRISVQLIDVASQRHLWSRDYDKEFKDVFKMEGEVAQRVAEALQVTLLGPEMQRLQKAPTANMEAFRMYQTGRYLWNKRTAGDIQKAVGYFNQSLAIDPGYAEAYSGLAACYLILPEYAYLRNEESMAQAQAAARKALELDPNLGEAHAVLANAMDASFNWIDAEPEYKLAIQLSPNNATAHHWFSVHLRYLGRLDESMIEIRRAEDLDPLSLVIKANVDEAFYFKGQNDEAIRACRKGLELDPNFAPLLLDLGTIYLKKRMYPEALATLRRVRELTPETVFGLGCLGYALARSGDKAQALKVLEELEGWRKKGVSVNYEIAFVYLGLDDLSRAFDSLEKAIGESGMLVNSIGTDPLCEDLRPDPRFQALLRKMNLVK